MFVLHWLLSLYSYDITNQGVALATTGTHLVPAAGCKMSKMIGVLGVMTIHGEIGSYRELQSNRVDDQDVDVNAGHHSQYPCYLMDF